jgi:hypothetical protein
VHQSFDGFFCGTGDRLDDFPDVGDERINTGYSQNKQASTDQSSKIIKTQGLLMNQDDLTIAAIVTACFIASTPVLFALTDCLASLLWG